jgi:CheY-like chemotaxis protein
VEFAVEDTGIGIPPEARERIFEGFYQVDGSEGRKYGGAGVGLALVRKLVELHGGRVEAESAGAGQGARFVIHLPWLKIPSPRRILLVEDDRILADGLVDVLGRAGYAVESTGTGGEALQILQGRPPDLLLLDIGLPDMDGWDILRHVRDTDRMRDLPILVLTGLRNASTEQAMALGASEFLTKPFSISVLVEVVARLLAHRLATSALTGD